MSVKGELKQQNLVKKILTPGWELVCQKCWQNFIPTLAGMSCLIFVVYGKKLWQFNACINLKDFYAVNISFYITIPYLYQPSFAFWKDKWSTVVGEEQGVKSPKHIKPFAVPHPNSHTWLGEITLSFWWIIQFSCHLHFWSFHRKANSWNKNKSFKRNICRKSLFILKSLQINIPLTNLCK